MKILKTTLYIGLALLFISCGDNTETPPVKDVVSIEIDDPTMSIYSTDSANLTATVTFTDSTTASVDNELLWGSSDLDIASVFNGLVLPGNANGGDANCTITYQDLTAAPSLITVIPLVSFAITNADINATGDYILEAKGEFEDGTTDKTIVKNIIWTADNGAIITVLNNISTITILAGDTNVTAIMFDETNTTLANGPQIKTYTVE